MIIASQVVIGILKETSYEFFVEYNEMNSIQELKLSLYQLLLQTNKYTLADNANDQSFFMILAQQTEQKLSDCERLLSDSHDKKIITEFPKRLNKIINLAKIYFNIKGKNKKVHKAHILKSMNEEITDGINQIDILLIETKIESVQYNETNSTAFLHSTIAILFLGIAILMIFVIGGVKFINNLTKPIHDFVATTKRIIGGERGIKIKIDTHDEFGILANSFNLMLESLENTTVSKSYLNNILNNMFDSLIVTDDKLQIRSTNQAATNLMGYKASWYVGKPLTAIFGKNNITFDTHLGKGEIIQSCMIQIKNLTYFINNTGEKIPALISCAALKTDNGESDGLIIVGHDLTIKKKIERELERNRKRRQIDINEAQEEERMRIAIDLHDGLGQILTAISYTAGEFQNIGILSNDEKEKLINKIEEQVDRAIKESKSIAQNLIPIVLKDFGLVAAMRNLIERANETYSITFSFDTFDYNERIDTKLEKTLYRICQESLNNIIKHSKAKTANYQLFRQDNIIVFVISDDGDGFDISLLKKKATKGIGLMSMRERVQAFDGNMYIDSQIGIGTEIIIEIPCVKN